MAQVRPETFDEAREAGPNARGGHPELGGDLGRVEARREPEREERAVIGIERTEDPGQVQRRDAVGGIRATRGVEGRDVEDGAAAVFFGDVLRLDDGLGICDCQVSVCDC